MKDINICVKMIFAGWCQFSTVGSHGVSVATSCQRYNGVYHYIVSLSKSSSLLSIIIYNVSSSKSYSRHFEHWTRIDKATPFQILNMHAIAYISSVTRIIQVLLKTKALKLVQDLLTFLYTEHFLW